MSQPEAAVTDPFQTIAADSDQSDQVALRMMLSYVEAECLRIGATDAARHAALAASLMPRHPSNARRRPTLIARPAGQRLH